MSYQSFLLDKTQTAKYNAAFSALSSYTAQDGKGTTAVARDIDANTALVFAHVTEAQINSDADLADLRLTGDFFVPNSFCRHRLPDSDHTRSEGFYLLGDQAKSDDPTVSAIRYVQQKPPGGGTQDGLTPWTAAYGFEDASLLVSSELPADRRYQVVNGCLYFLQEGGINFGSQGKINPADGASTVSLIWATDNALNPGVLTDYWLDNSGTAGQAAWVQDGTNLNVWSQSDWYSGTGNVNRPLMVFGGDFPVTGRSTDWHDEWILEQKTSLAEVRSAPYSFWLDGNTLHVNFGTTVSPDTTGRKVLRESFGYRLEPRRVSAYQPRIVFKNLQSFGHDWVVALLIGNTSGNTWVNARAVSFQGGRYIWSISNWFMHGACEERTFFRGTRCYWDTSDRRNTPTSEGRQRNVADGSDAGIFTDYERDFEIGYATLGPHPSQTVGAAPISGFPADWRQNGIYYHHLEDTKGFPRDNADRHCAAIRGNFTTDPLVQNFYFYRVSNGIYWYAVSDAGDRAPVQGGANSILTWLVEDGVLDTWNGANPTAGTWMFLAGGDNDTIQMDDGVGGRRIGTARRLCLIDFRPTGVPLGSPPQEAGGSMSPMNSDMEWSVVDSSIIRSNWGFRGDRAGHIEAFSSIQMTNPNTDITLAVIQGTNTPTSIPVSSTNFLAIGRQQGKHRRAQINLTTPGAGTAVVEWRYYNGTAIVPIPTANLADGTNGLTQSGTLTFDKPTDWVADTVGSRTAFHIYAALTSGSWTTVPVMDQCRSRQTGFNFTARDIYIEEPEEGCVWVRANTWNDGAHVLDLDRFTIKLKAGQDSATWLGFRFGTTGGQQTAAAFQARTKLAVNTDADRDSVFLPNLTFV